MRRRERGLRGSDEEKELRESDEEKGEGMSPKPFVITVFSYDNFHHFGSHHFRRDVTQ